MPRAMLAGLENLQHLFPNTDLPLDFLFSDQRCHFIEQIIASNRCSVATNSMSTQITGESTDVFDSVRQALETSYEAFGRQVLVAKFIPEHHTDVEPPAA